MRLPGRSAAEQIQQIAVTSEAQVIVFPEAVVNRWTESTDTFWQPTIAKIQARGKTILIGAGLPLPGTASEIRNAVVIPGARLAEPFEQRVPVPLAMWKPWGKARVRLNLFGRSTASIVGQRAAILICYEQLLPWSYLTAFPQRPTVLIGVANASWTKHTVTPIYQSATLHSWGRLFGTPVISATNY